MQPAVQGVLFFSSGEDKVAGEETDLTKWAAFLDAEKQRGVNLAILIGGEPTLCLDRVEQFYRRMPTYCATNGLIKVPRDRFPGMMVGISLWGTKKMKSAFAARIRFLFPAKIMKGIPTPITCIPSRRNRSEEPKK